MLSNQSRIRIFLLVPLLIPAIALCTTFSWSGDVKRYGNNTGIACLALMSIGMMSLVVNVVFINRIKKYLIIVSIFSAMAFMPVLLFFGLFLLMVPAFFMVLSVNVAFYSLFFAHMIFEEYNNFIKNSLFCISLLLIGVTAVVPYFISSQKLKSIAYEARNNDIDYLNYFNIKKIVLASNNHGWGGGSQHPAVICNETCQRLLYNKEVDTVYMMFVSGDKLHPEQPKQVSYHIERRDVCPQYYSKAYFTPYSEAVQRNISKGLCLIAEDVREEISSDFMITELENDYRSPGEKSIPRPTFEEEHLDPRRVKEIVVSGYTEVLGSKKRLVYQSTSVRGDVAGWPLAFTVGGGSDLHFCIEIFRKEMTIHKSSIDHVLKDKLGFKLAPVAAIND